MDSGMSITVEEVDDECPPPLTKSRGGMGAMETDDQWGEEKGLMEKFLEDFDLDGILDDPRDDDDARGSVSTGPNKRGRTIKKRRKQGISPTDPRKFYTDRLVNALCSGDIEKVRVVMERYHEPDCVYIQRFTNNTPDLPAYREIHGREQMLAFYKAFLASSPDCVVKVTDRQLNVYQDGSSYLVSKMNFSGAWLFRIFFSNIVRRTRSFLNRTFFNRPTIINPFRPKKGASSSSSSSSMTSLSAMSTDSGASTTRNDKESSAYMFASFRRKKSVTGAVTATAAMMSAPTDGAPVEPLLLPDDHHHHQSLSRSTDPDVASSPLSSHSHHASSSEEAPSIRYLHGDMHLVAGKASDYESDARPPTPLSPLSTASSQPDVQPPLPPLPPPPLPPQLSPNASLSTSASPGLANVDADVVVEGPPEVLEAEAPWDDLPFTIVRDEAQSSTPIPAPAALIVTPESKVSVVTAQPKPYRVNIAISHVAHINPAGRIFKTEMFLKAEVSISWWAAAKNQAGTTKDLEPLPEEDNDNDEDHDDGFIGPNEGDEGDEVDEEDEEDEEDEAIRDTNGIVVDEVNGPVACLDDREASSATAVPATATTQTMNAEPFVST